MIAAEQVTVSFRRGLWGKRLKALDGFSLTVQEGDLFGLLGPNGAGKSTAMYCFLGLIRPDAGQVTVSGQRVFPGSPLFQEVAYLPEEPHYHLYLTVEEAVGYYAALYGNGADRRKVKQSIERVGLAEFRDLKLSKCSKGMKQKVGIAQCLINTPRVVFLDEPTRGLDPLMVKEFREVLLEMHRGGATILLNSHLLSEIEMLCNRVAILHRGRVVAQEEVSRLRSLNLEIYQVECEAAESTPDYFDVKIRTSRALKGEIPTDKLGEFIRFAEAAGIRVHECSLKKVTLEEAFFNVLKGVS